MITSWQFAEQLVFTSHYYLLPSGKAKDTGYPYTDRIVWTVVKEAALKDEASQVVSLMSGVQPTLAFLTLTWLAGHAGESCVAHQYSLPAVIETTLTSSAVKSPVSSSL